MSVLTPQREWILEVWLVRQEAVDPDRARAHRATDALSPGRVARTDDSGEPVARAVGERHRRRFVVESLHGKDRAEDFVLDDLGVVRAGLDQRRLVPQACRQISSEKA